MTKEDCIKQTGLRKEKEVIRREKSTSMDVVGDMDILKKIYEEMKKMQKEQEEMKVLVKVGLHGGLEGNLGSYKK